MSSANRDPLGYYKMLDLSPDASALDIRLAYERVITVALSNRMAFAAEMAATAYKTLSDQASRRSYDPGFNPTSDSYYLECSRFQEIMQQPLLPLDSRPKIIPPPNDSPPHFDCGIRGSVAGFDLGDQGYKPKSWWDRLLD